MYSALAVTPCHFEHFRRSFHLLTYLLTYLLTFCVNHGVLHVCRFRLKSTRDSTRGAPSSSSRRFCHTFPSDDFSSPTTMSTGKYTSSLEKNSSHSGNSLSRTHARCLPPNYLIIITIVPAVAEIADRTAFVYRVESCTVI